jgi:hypothetical protein
MDAELFCQRAQLTPGLNDYLDEVAAKAEAATTDQEKGPAALLFAVVAYALYRLAKNYLDHQRGLQAAELIEIMMQQVQILVDQGWDPKVALDTVSVISKEVSSLRTDTSELKAALAIAAERGPA